MKLAFGVLDLENSSSFETSGRGYGNPCISNAGVANSASELSRVLHLERRSKIRQRSDPYSLHWLTLRLEFMTLVSPLLLRFSVPVFTEFLTFWFLLLAGSGSLSQYFASSLGSWENI